MKTLHKTALFLAASFAGLAWTVRSAAESPVREKNSFDEGWKFALGNAADKVKDFEYCVGMPLAKTGSDRNAYGAILADFNDSAWRTVDLPHDWAVELPFMTDPKYFPQTPWYVFHHGYKPVGPPFPETSVGWYRKSFDIPRTDDGRRISIVFDGAFRDTEVWLNNYRIGRHEGGYTGFRFDITDYLKFGGKNTLSVRVDAGKYEGWFYEGAGIYRHVWMEKTNPLHITPLGLKIVADGAGKVTARVGIANDGSAAPRALEANVAILDADGRTVAQASQAMQIGEAVDLPELVIADPKLWSPETPNLYRYAVELRANGKVVDQVKTTFGVRVIAFDPEKGLLLNGKRVQIKGACCHQDHAGVGVAVPDSLLEWRLRELKKWGFNAYRTSHHAPAPELLDLCDRLGVMVLDENRNIGSSPDVLDDLRFLVERDRNHPCVIAWSMGNEEVVQSTPQAARFGATMKKLVRRLDGTRPVTYACNGGADTRGIMGQMDVFGINYTRIGDFDGLHRRCPDLPMFGTEEGSAVYTRGDYNQRHVSAYDIHLGGGWARQAEDWMKHFSSRQWLAGAFLWTGFDYRGEPLPGDSWPHISSYFGVLDTCGFPKDVAWYYKACWTDEPVLHLFPHWNWPGRAGQPIDVWCYSNHEEVELFLNGKSLGRQAMPHLGHAAWKVNYAPGRLTAKGYRQGQVVEETAVATTGAPAKLDAEASKTVLKADGKDCVVVNVSACDAEGSVVPTANLPVEFMVSKNARILGVGNGDEICHEADTFVSVPGQILPLKWRMRQADGSWKDVATNQLQITTANTEADFRSVFSVTEAQLTWLTAAPLIIPTIDDTGTVRVNGTVAGECPNYQTPFRADIMRWLKPGENTVEVHVRNVGGTGGLAGDTAVMLVPRTVAWRSTFNGYCQVIVAAPKEPGEFTVSVSAKGLAPAELKLRAE